MENLLEIFPTIVIMENPANDFSSYCGYLVPITPTVIYGLRCFIIALMIISNLHAMSIEGAYTFKTKLDIHIWGVCYKAKFLYKFSFLFG